MKNPHHELDSIKSEGVSTAQDAKITQSPLPPLFRAVLIFRCFYWSTVAPTAVLGVPELSQISDVLGELFSTRFCRALAPLTSRWSVG